MKKLSLLFVPLLFAFASCQKENLKPITTANNTAPTTPTPATNQKSQGYLVVQCDNCEIQYGMPDQYNSMTVSGISGKGYFNYQDGYTLKSYIIAYDHTQRLTISVYDKNSKLIQTNATTQGTTGYWETNITVQTK